MTGSLIFDPVSIYTDACHYYGVCTGCTVLVGKDVPAEYLPVYYPLAEGSSEAEILSAIAGLQRAPKMRPLRLLTDMDMLLGWPAARIRRNVCHRMALEVFADEIDKHPGLQIQRVDRHHAYYRHCHNRARALAKGVWRKTHNLPLGPHDELPAGMEPFVPAPRAQRPETVAENIIRQIQAADERAAQRRESPPTPDPIGWGQGVGWRKNWPDG